MSHDTTLRAITGSNKIIFEATPRPPKESKLGFLPRNDVTISTKMCLVSKTAIDRCTGVDLLPITDSYLLTDYWLPNCFRSR